MQWFLTKFLEVKKANIIIRRIEDDILLPLVEYEEYKLLLKFSQRCYHNKGDKKHNHCVTNHPKCKFLRQRNKLIIKFLYDTGARASEVCNLEVKHYKNGKGTFYRTKGNKKRKFKVSKEVGKDLVAFITQWPHKFK